MCSRVGSYEKESSSENKYILFKIELSVNNSYLMPFSTLYNTNNRLDCRYHQKAESHNQEGEIVFSGYSSLCPGLTIRKIRL